MLCFHCSAQKLADYTGHPRKGSLFFKLNFEEQALVSHEVMLNNKEILVWGQGMVGDLGLTHKNEVCIEPTAHFYEPYLGGLAGDKSQGITKPL